MSMKDLLSKMTELQGTDTNEETVSSTGKQVLTESAERPYVCVHAKKGKCEVKANSSYEAAKKAADKWKLKSTAGIDAHLADKPISTASLEENTKPSLKSMFNSLLAEAEQITIQPAKQNTQVIKQGQKTLGTVENPQLAAQIKQSIGKGEMTLAGDDLQEDDMSEGLDPAQKQNLKSLIDAYRNATDPEAYEYDISPDDIIDQIRQQFGDKIADTISQGPSMHYPRPGHVSGVYDPLANKSSPRVTKSGKINKQDSEFMKRNIKQQLGINEKWGEETKVSPSEKGKYEGKTKAELLKQYNSLKASGPHKEGSSEYGKMRELAFAIRAKSGWGKVDESKLNEKAVSKSQQQAAGAALAAKRGDAPKSNLKGASKEMAKMSTKELEKFAKTKHKGLPEKKKTNESISSSVSDWFYVQGAKKIVNLLDSGENVMKLATMISTMDPKKQNDLVRGIEVYLSKYPHDKLQKLSDVLRVKTNEALEKDGPKSGDLNFNVPTGEKGKEYVANKAKQRSDMNKKNDPGAAKKGLALSVVDREKAANKAKKKTNEAAMPTHDGDFGAGLGAGRSNTTLEDRSSRRLIDSDEKGNRAYKIYVDRDWQEYVVKFYENGKYLPDADYHADEEQEAMDTGYHFLNNLTEGKKAKPDYIDLDKDGNKKESMKKAAADKQKVSTMKKTTESKAKPDYIDLDKDGNKKEPMKKAAADAKKQKVAVKEEESSLSWSSTRTKKSSPALCTKHNKPLSKKGEGADAWRGCEDCPQPKTTKKTVKEGANPTEAARLLGKAHALAKDPFACKYESGTPEAQAYLDGYKEGLDECYGSDSMGDSGMSGIAVMPGMGSMVSQDSMMDSPSPRGGSDFEFGGFDDVSDDDMMAFESWDRELNALLNEGKMKDIDTDMQELSDAAFKKEHGKTKTEMKKSLSSNDTKTDKKTVKEGISVSVSKGQQGAPDSVSVTAQDGEADALLAMIKQAGLGLFGGEETSGYGAPTTPQMPTSGSDVGDHDSMMALIKKMTTGAQDYEDEESQDDQHVHGHPDAACDTCGSSDCGCDDSDSKALVVGEEESEDQMEFEVAEANAPDSDEAETAADENAEAEEDKALAGADSDNEEEIDEGSCSMDEEEELTEWANDAGYTGSENTKDNTFEQDIEFMTKVISGGLNGQKRDQTTLPHTKVKVEESDSISDWKKLSGIR